VHKIISSALCIFLALLWVCSKACVPTTSSVAGEYQLEDPAREATLELKANGTFLEVVRSGPTVHKVKGSWQLEGETLYRKPCIEFEVLDAGIHVISGCAHPVIYTARGVLIQIHVDFPPRYGKVRSASPAT
jgi:hypothetical protein